MACKGGTTTDLSKHLAKRHYILVERCAAFHRPWETSSAAIVSTGAFLVSGIYDLLPILPTYINEPLKMTEDVAARNSPSQLVSQLQLSSPSCQIIVAVAENDSPEFRKQSEEYYTTLRAAGLKVSLEDVPDTDHFSVIDQMVDPEYGLTKLLLKMMDS